VTSIVFVNPLDSSILTRGLGIKTPPLNLMYLASAAEKAGFSPRILDANLLKATPEKVAKMLGDLTPDLVGLTATTATVSKAFAYIKKIREVLADCFIFIGGPHVTFLPTETLADCPELDAVVIGEGEETVVDLARSFDAKAPCWPESVKGIAYRKREGDRDKFVVTQPRPLIEDLDSIPFPARHLVPYTDYQLFEGDTAPGLMITSRGCTFACNYCSSSHLMGKKFRPRSPMNVVDEIEELVSQYKVTNLEFLDDNFMLNRPRVLAISREIKSRGLDITFVASSRVNE